MMWRLLRGFYSVVLTLLLPIVFLRLWIRGRKLPAYRKRWLERLGLPPFPPLESVIWIHAVSVGESVSTFPLIKQLKLRYPNTPLLITTTTPTGSERIQAAFRDYLGKSIYHCYLPYDTPLTLNAFFERVQPQLLVLMETELWPNLLMKCQQNHIPVLIANARLSARSIARYRWLGPLMRCMTAPVTQVAAQSQIDVQRFQSIGIPASRIQETGNIKFDLQLPTYIQDEGVALRQSLGHARCIWVAASTHDNEEDILLRTYQALKAHIPTLLLLLVPRHPERFSKVAQLCESSGLHVVRRSENKSCDEKVDVFLGDTMGEMLLFYAAADIAFVGGSLVPVGGHNLLEPAALGLPILTGPHVFNFAAISDMLSQAKGLQMVQNETQLKETVLAWSQDPKEAKQVGHNALTVVQRNKGALDRLITLITTLNPVPSSVVDG